jgi:hypothetical protein
LIILLKANEMASLMCVIYASDIRYTRELVDNVDILINLLIPEKFAMQLITWLKKVNIKLFKDEEKS